MSDIMPFVIAGLADGAVYGLAAVGLVLTFRTSGVFNFGHGSLAAVAAYVFYELNVTHGWPWPVAVVVTVALVGLVGGLALERISYWLSEADTVSRVVATIAIVTGVTSLLLAVFGATPKQLQPYLPTTGFEVAGVVVSVGDLTIFLIGLGGTGALYLFLRRARYGLAMQAVVEDDRLLSLQGTDPAVVRRLSWTIGTSFAAISGVVLAPRIGVDVSVLTFLVLTALGAAAVGAFNSLPLTFAGALGIGVVSSVMSDQFANASSFAVQNAYQNVPFVVLFLVLVFVPRSKLVERGVKIVRPPSPLPAFSPRTRAATSGAALAAVFAFAVFDEFKIPIFATATAFVILFASLALLTWTAGQVSLGHIGFAAIGAAAFSHALSRGFPWLIGLVVAGIVAGVVGMLVAIPSVRVSGIYVAIVTFGFGVLLERFFYPTFLMFGDVGVQVRRPSIPVVDITSDRGYLAVSVVVCAVCLGAMAATRRSRLGRILRGFGESPVALEAHGMSLVTAGVIVFGMSSFFAGIAGAVLAGVVGSAAGFSFNFSVSLGLVAVLAAASLVVGGARLPTVVPVLAAVMFQVLKAYTDSPTFVDYQGVVFAVLALVATCGPGIASSLSSRGIGLTGRWSARQRASDATRRATRLSTATVRRPA